MQLQRSTVTGCLVRCCCFPFSLCFSLLQSVVGIFLWWFGAVLLVSVLLSDFSASGWFGSLRLVGFSFCFFFERTRLVFNTVLCSILVSHQLVLWHLRIWVQCFVNKT